MPDVAKATAVVEERPYQVWFNVAGAMGLICLVAGLLAWRLPFLELANDLRPITTATAAAALLAALVWSDRSAAIEVAAVVLGSLIALLLPVMFVAKPARGAPQLLRLMSFNINVANERYGDIAQFIRESAADIVLLQEVDDASLRKVARHLGQRYPFIIGGGPRRDIGIALLARRPPVESGVIDRTPSNPALVWGRFTHAGSSYEIIGVYLAYPFHPTIQDRHVTWLIEHARTKLAPLIVAGDFNLTPFSAKLNKLALLTGLRRHATWRASWPAKAPLFLIDHVFSDRIFCSRKVSIGPNLGSDHRPIIVDILSFGTPSRPDER